jgi:hypothetical protein
MIDTKNTMASNVAAAVRELQKQQEERHQAEADHYLLSWLAPTDYGSQHSDLLNRREEGTANGYRIQINSASGLTRIDELYSVQVYLERAKRSWLLSLSIISTPNIKMISTSASRICSATFDDEMSRSLLISSQVYLDNSFRDYHLFPKVWEASMSTIRLMEPGRHIMKSRRNCILLLVVIQRLSSSSMLWTNCPTGPVANYYRGFLTFKS